MTTLVIWGSYREKGEHFLWDTLYMYLTRAVGTVFEIATFPLDTILHSMYYKHFFHFFKKNLEKNTKNGNFSVFCHNFPLN